MKKIISILIIVIFFTTGCASIISKSDWPVTINSNPEGAIITVTDENGLRIYKGNTPTTLTLRAGKAYFDGLDYTVTFAKGGYESQTIVISSKLNGWYIGNILFGGLIGILVVDPLTGAMWRLNSPVIANLVEKTASIEQDEFGLHIVMINDVPEHLRSQMVRIK